MNLNNFKILKEDAEHYTVGHPNGKSLKVPKAGMSESAKKLVAKLKPQHFDDGGSVVPIDNILGNMAPQQAVAQETPIQEAPQQIVPTPQPVAASVQPQVVDPLVAQKMGSLGVLDQQEKAIQDFARSQGAAGAEAQKAWKDYNDQIAARPNADQVAADYKQKEDQLFEKVKSGEIDPNRYLNNMSTGSKVAAGLSMVLGGFATNHGGPNPGLQVFNQAINNDIESQKNDQAKNMNLWKMNHQALGDSQAADIATRNQLLTAVQAKAAMAANQTQNATARLNAAQMISQIEQEKNQNRMRLGLLTQGQGPSGTGSSQADPLSLVNEMVPKEQQEKAITEIGQAQHAAKNEQEMMSLFDQASKENTVLRTGGGFLRTPGSVLNLKLLASPLIHDNVGRVNEFEQKNLENVLPQPGDTESKIAEKKRGFQDFINLKKQAPTAKANGINIENFASTSNNPADRLNAKEKQYYAFAKANPDNPISQAFFKKTGLR